MTTHEDHATHAALCVVFGDWGGAYRAWDDAWVACSGGADCADPFEYGRLRAVYSGNCRKCWQRRCSEVGR